MSLLALLGLAAIQAAEPAQTGAIGAVTVRQSGLSDDGRIHYDLAIEQVPGKTILRYRFGDGPELTYELPESEFPKLDPSTRLVRTSAFEGRPVLFIGMGFGDFDYSCNWTTDVRNWLTIYLRPEGVSELSRQDYHKCKHRDRLVFRRNPKGPSEDEIEATRLRLEGAGFRSLAAATADGAEIRRATYSDELLRLPSVELRRRDGQVTVAMHNGGHEVQSAVDPASWDRLSLLEDAAFQPDDQREVRRIDKRLRGRCHGFSMQLESASGGQTRSRWASECYAMPHRAALTYATELARIAIAATPQCAGARGSDIAASEALAICARRFGDHTQEYRRRMRYPDPPRRPPPPPPHKALSSGRKQ